MLWPTRDQLVLRLAHWLVRALGATWRVRTEGEEPLRERIAAGERVLIYSCHEVAMPGAVFLRRYRPVILASLSRDGQAMARLLEGLGWSTVPGSSSRMGHEGLVAMVDAIEDGRTGAIIADGPRGPAGSFKPGVVAIAQRSGAALFSFHVHADWCWRAPTWDAAMLPLPGSRVLFRFGEARSVPADLARQQFDDLLEELEEDYAAVSAGLGRPDKRIMAP